MESKVTIAIVTYNSGDYIEKCLAAIPLDGIVSEIIVWDNGSSDATVELVKASGRSVTLIEGEENLGYSRANNKAMSMAKTDYCILLNPDAFFSSPYNVRDIVAYMDAHKDVAICGPQLQNYDGSHQVGDAGWRINASNFLAHFLLYHRTVDQRKSSIYLTNRKLIQKDAVLVDWVCGACLCVRSDAFRNIGGLDEAYFMYGEDIEWGVRARNRGYGVVYLPQIKVLHIQGALQVAVGRVTSSKKWLDDIFFQLSKSYSKTTCKILALILAFAFFIRSGATLASGIITSNTIGNRHRARIQLGFARYGVSLFLSPQNRAAKTIPLLEKSGVGKMRVHVQLPYKIDVERYSSRYCNNLEPEFTPYGFHIAQRLGYETTYSTPRFGVFGRITSRGLIRISGVDVFHAASNWIKIRRSDVVWTMIESDWLGIAILRWTLPARLKIIGSNVWIFNKWNTFNKLTKSIYRYLSYACDKLVVHTEPCANLANTVLPHVRTEILYFGISNSTFSQDTKAVLIDDILQVSRGKIKIFAPGNDSTRDWDTLINAFRNDDRFELLIVCDWLRLDKYGRLDNVEIVRSPSRSQFIELYRSSDIVAIPMKYNIFSGITVALEAAALRRPIVSSLTGGVPSYFTKNEVVYVPLGSPELWKSLVLSRFDSLGIYARNGHRKFCERNYTSSGMVDQYVKMSESMISIQSKKAFYFGRQ